MNGVVIVASLLVVPGWSRDRPLDKTGTTGSTMGVVGSQALKKKEPARAGSFAAERAGFEPAVGFYPHAALAKRRQDVVTTKFATTSEPIAQPGAAPGAAAPPDPELARVVTAWPALPDPIRRAVLALIGSVLPPTKR